MDFLMENCPDLVPAKVKKPSLEGGGFEGFEGILGNGWQSLKLTLAAGEQHAAAGTTTMTLHQFEFILQSLLRYLEFLTFQQDPGTATIIRILLQGVKSIMPRLLCLWRKYIRVPNFTIRAQLQEILESMKEWNKLGREYERKALAFDKRSNKDQRFSRHWSFSLRNQAAAEALNHPQRHEVIRRPVVSIQIPQGGTMILHRWMLDVDGVVAEVQEAHFREIFYDASGIGDHYSWVIAPQRSPNTPATPNTIRRSTLAVLPMPSSMLAAELAKQLGDHIIDPSPGMVDWVAFRSFMTEQGMKEMAHKIEWHASCL